MSNKKKKTGNLAGLVGFGVSLLLIAGLFKPRSFIGCLIGLGVSVGVGAVLRLMGQGLDTSVNLSKSPRQLQQEAEQKAKEEVEQQTVQQAEQKVKQQAEQKAKAEALTGDAEADALLKRGRSMIAQIRAENDLIPDSALTEKLNELEASCAEVFDAVLEKPARAPVVRKFMEYYLPTTLKMVQGCRLLDEKGISGEEAAQAKTRIGDMLGMVVNACDQVRGKLYRGDVLDLSTDIDVLEQMLKMDGFTESDLDAAEAQALKAAEIDKAVDAAAQERRAAKETEEAEAAKAESEEAAKTQDGLPVVPTLDAAFAAYREAEAQAAAQARMPE